MKRYVEPALVLLLSLAWGCAGVAVLVLGSPKFFLGVLPLTYAAAALIIPCVCWWCWRKR